MAAVLSQNELIHLVSDRAPFRVVVGGVEQARALASILDCAEAPHLVALLAYHQPALSAMIARVWQDDVQRLHLIGDLYDEAERLECRYAPTRVRIAE